MKTGVAFAPIDARDNPETGYHTVNFVSLDGRWPEPIEKIGRENTRTLYLMEQEYLTRLFQLQVEIQEKYASRYIENDFEKVHAEDFKKFKENAQIAFPGRCADWYD